MSEYRLNHEVTQTLRPVVDNAGAVEGFAMHTEPKRREEIE